MTAAVVRYGDLAHHVGRTFGPSGWHLVTQADVDAYATATNDHQWYCEDVERAARESPFAGTVAPGYFVLALAPGLLKEVWYVEGSRLAMNYGIERLRFPAPLRVGVRVRIHATLKNVRTVEDGQQVTLSLSFESQGGDKPVCAADVVYRFLA